MIRFEKNDNLENEIKETIKTGLTASAIFVQGVSKELAPVRDGILRDSITYDVDENKARISSPVEYAPYQEFGTSKMKAQPYLRPSVYGNVKKIQAIIANYMRKKL